MADRQDRSQDPTQPPRARERGRRVARRILRLRHEVQRYRRTSIALGGALALALVVVAGVALEADQPGRVNLGNGPAGIEEPAPETARDVIVPEEPPPPPARSLGGGSASYYSDSLEGRPTASGQRYRGSDLTAAHRTLPFGSRVRVTHLANGRSVVVRVNDRGPYAGRRVIDVSRAAAGRLGMLDQGHARVRLELLE